MRIILVHKYLYRKAGAEAYFFDLADLLIARGHEVAMWGLDKNVLETKKKYTVLDPLVSDADFSRFENPIKDLKKVFRMLWSLEAKEKFALALDEFKPDIVHIHNIYHHLSPSILSVTTLKRIPVVISVHDWHLINPNHAMFDHGAVCERKGLRCILHKCINNSFLASKAAANTFAWHRFIGAYDSNISYYFTPSEFVKNKLITNGLPEKKMVLLPYVIHPPEITGELNPHVEPYILFAGRLSEEKGLSLLLETAIHIPEINIKIAGSGPEENKLKNKIEKFSLKNVEMLGFQEKDNLNKLILQARLIVVPSIWYDPSPFAVLEAQAMGKAVLGSRIGGIPDLIKDGETGFLLDVAHERIDLTPQIWADKIKLIFSDEALLKRVGEQARQHVSVTNSALTHYEMLTKYYDLLVNK